MKRSLLVHIVIIWLGGMSLAACGSAPGKAPMPPAATSPAAEVAPVDREASIPTDAIKISPVTDELPPLLESEAYEPPVPVPGLVNTAGLEDSPFITPDGNTLYFFFTPDLHLPAEQQLLDGVTGIYVSQKVDGIWGMPERVLLQEPGKLALDGCAFVAGETLWFCTGREGLTGIHWFTAQWLGGRWQNWQPANFDPAYQVGELHISGDGAQLYFHADRPDGKGELDIWVSRMVDGAWKEPVNVAAVNSGEAEGWPALSPDGSALWFSRSYGIWKSEQLNGEWQAPVQVVTSLAGEPSVDEAGNLYFVHHFLVNDTIIEADIYVAYGK